MSDIEIYKISGAYHVNYNRKFIDYLTDGFIYELPNITIKEEK